MNKLTALYSEADVRDIDVMCIDTNEICSVSILSDTGNCYIGINPFSLQCASDELVHLAHEIGHCVTGSFYNRYSKLDIRARHERRANIWAIKKLIPKDELDNVAATGCTELYDLAEYFNVTMPFMKMAIKYYRGNL